MNPDLRFSLLDSTREFLFRFNAGTSPVNDSRLSPEVSRSAPERNSRRDRSFSVDRSACKSSHGARIALRDERSRFGRDHLQTRIKHRRVTWRGRAIRWHGPDRLRASIPFQHSFSLLFSPRCSAICRTGARTSNEEALTIRAFEGPLTRWSTKSWRCS